MSIILVGVNLSFQVYLKPIEINHKPIGGVRRGGVGREGRAPLISAF